MKRLPLTALLSMLALGTLVTALGAQAPVSDVAQTPESVARLLVERHSVAEIPLKGKVKRKIDLKDETFALPGGPSRVVLLKLPEYKGAYALTVKSFLFKRAMSRTEKMFVPTTMMLDENFVVTRTVSEDELKSNSQGMTKGPSYEASFPFTEAQAAERFLLIFTQGSAVGGGIQREHESDIIRALVMRSERSADGDIEVETKPTK